MAADRITLALRAPVQVESMRDSERDDVTALLRDLSVDYPGGDGWLQQRLEGVVAGDATCWVARHATGPITGVPGSPLAGVLILTPKPTAMKLSTIFVAPGARGCGLGSALLDRAMVSAREQGRLETYVTVAHHKQHLLRPLLVSRGFTRVARVPDRYGPGRHELVYTRLDS